MILLTGATGHTGRRLAARLLERGGGMRCLLHTPARRSRLPDDQPGLEIVQGSLENPDDVARALDGVDAVLNLAHVRFAPGLVDALAARGGGRLIVSSSTRALSSFPTPLRETVRRCEEAVREAPDSVRWTILRPAMIFGGPGDNNIERLARFLARSPVFPLFGKGENLVQPLFVLDFVDAILAALDRPEAEGETLTLAGPEAMTYRDMAASVARASGRRGPVFLPLPRGICLGAARALRAVWPGSPLDPEVVRRFGEDRAFNIGAAEGILGFKPRSFGEALELKFRREV